MLHSPVLGFKWPLKYQSTDTHTHARTHAHTHARTHTVHKPTTVCLRRMRTNANKSRTKSLPEWAYLYSSSTLIGSLGFEAEAQYSISMVVGLASRIIIFSTFLLPLGVARDLHSCVEPKCNTSLSSPLSQVNCKCDDDCALYGDCCLDYTANSTSRPSALHGLLECQKVHTSGVLMVSRCPIQSELNIPCTNRSLFLPVTDPSSNFTFRNIYCALCNNVSREVVVPWQPHFFCGGEVNVSSIRTFESLENACRASGSVIFSKTSILRTCIPHISTCPSSVDADLVHNCTSGPYDLVTAGPVAAVFKNRYCAQCNGADADDILCLTHFNLTNSPSNTTGISLWHVHHIILATTSPMHG